MPRTRRRGTPPHEPHDREVPRRDRLSSFFISLGRFTVRFRFLIVLAWIVVTILAVRLLPSLSDVAKDTTSGFLPANTPSMQAAAHGGAVPGRVPGRRDPGGRARRRVDGRGQRGDRCDRAADPRHRQGEGRRGPGRLAGWTGTPGARPGGGHRVHRRSRSAGRRRRDPRDVHRAGRPCWSRHPPDRPVGDPGRHGRRVGILGVHDLAALARCSSSCCCCSPSARRLPRS